MGVGLDGRRSRGGPATDGDALPCLRGQGMKRGRNAAGGRDGAPAVCACCDACPACVRVPRRASRQESESPSLLPDEALLGQSLSQPGKAPAGV